VASEPLTWRRPVSADHARIMAVIDNWWGGRSMQAMVPRLFLDHFSGTSYVVEDADGGLAAFIIAFASPDDPETTYVHFIGVDPARRGRGLGRELYARISAEAVERGCSRLKAVTSPVNTASQAFHRSIGFEVGDPVPDYDAPDEPRIPLLLRLPSPHSRSAAGSAEGYRDSSP